MFQAHLEEAETKTNGTVRPPKENVRFQRENLFTLAQLCFYANCNEVLFAACQETAEGFRAAKSRDASPESVIAEHLCQLDDTVNEINRA